MADVLDIDNAEDFEVDDDGDREYLARKQQYLSSNLKICRRNRPAEGKSPKTERTRLWTRPCVAAANPKLRECAQRG